MKTIEYIVTTVVLAVATFTLSMFSFGSMMLAFDAVYPVYTIQELIPQMLITFIPIGISMLFFAYLLEDAYDSIEYKYAE